MQEPIAPRRVLVLYWTPLPPSALRAAIRHHLEAIKLSPTQHRVTFWNAFEGTPVLVRRGGYDAVILHTTLLCLRWFGEFAAWRDRLRWIGDLDCLKIAMPQDEYDHSEILDEWLRDLGVNHVFSNFKPDLRPLLYTHMVQKAEFHEVLTGYIDEDMARRLEMRLKPPKSRPLDVVYRATHLPFWFGSLGRLKHLVGERALVEVHARGLTADISTRTDDAIMGDEWFDFLAAGRVVVGCESGSSVLDPQGGIQASIRAYFDEHPDADFDEVSARMPPGWDSYHFAAVSPRHFEAIITKTCQVLVQGRYDDVFVPGRHYLPVRPDLADLGDALQAASDPAVASELSARTYEEIYRSGRYTYRALAEQIDGVLATRPAKLTRLGPATSALATRFGEWRLNHTSDFDPGSTLALVDQRADRAPAMPWIQLARLMGHRLGRRAMIPALNGRAGRGLLRAYLRAGAAGSSIPAGRLVAECGLLDRLSRAQAVQPRTPSSRAIKAVSEAATLELAVLRRPNDDHPSVDEYDWPPQSIVVRLPSFGGLTADPSGDGWHSGFRLDAVSALAAIRPIPVQAALRQLLDTVGGARSRPRSPGWKNRLKTLLATARVLLARPANLWLLASAIGRAPLADTADDLLKLALLRGLRGSSHVASFVESKTKTLCLVTEQARADRRDSHLSTGAEIMRIVWDNSAVSNSLSAPVAFGRRVTVYLGAGGVHEFTEIQALPRFARSAILRQLEADSATS